MKNITKKIKILHVDDTEDTLSVVKIILENEGFEVVSINQGINALKEVELNGFDLVILDIMMPDISGWEIFTKIATIKPNYKVIFLSVLELTKERVKQLTDSGIKDYIRKPFDRDDLVARVKKVINEKN